MNHINFYRIFFIGLFIMLASRQASAQDIPITWGDIPRADLEMKSFPQDTNASAVILCDYCDARLSEDLDLTYTRHLRIKILTKKGFRYGTHSFILYTKSDIEKLKKIEGVTYSLNDRGEIEKDQFLEKDILSKEIDGRRTNLKITMPLLKPGCIIELRYTISSQSIFFNDWTFQLNEPVRWSEYRITFPNENVSFSAIHQGKLKYAISENIPTRLYGGKSFIKMRWAVQDAPALREEPYMTTIENYCQKVFIQLSGYKHFFSGAKQVLNNWQSFRDEFLNDADFGRRIEDSRLIRNQAEQISYGLSSPQDKMKAIYSWTAKSIVCSGDNTPYAWRPFDEILETKKGNCAEINFLLMSLLKSAGIQVDPVILSTRNNGKFKESYPIASQFDYVLARAKIDTQFYFLDATDPDRSSELLPKKVLNTTGLVIKKDTLEWVKLATPKRYTNISAATIDLKADGSLSGTLEDLYRDYGSYEMRNDIKDKKDIDIVKDAFDTESREIALDSIDIQGKTSTELPLKIRAKISSSTYAQTSKDLIYFNPHIVHQLKENPLKSERRNFPLDYTYPREFSTMVNFAIPDSFEVQESIVSRNLIVGANFSLFSRRVFISGKQIRVQYRWEIRQTEIDTAYYNQMRDFYAQIIAIEAEQFVFARIKAPAISPLPLAPAATDPKTKGKK